MQNKNKCYYNIFIRILISFKMVAKYLNRQYWNVATKQNKKATEKIFLLWMILGKEVLNVFLVIEVIFNLTAISMLQIDEIKAFHFYWSVNKSKKTIKMYRMVFDWRSKFYILWWKQVLNCLWKTSMVKILEIKCHKIYLKLKTKFKF